jgi:hypothetical protein
MVGEGFSVFGKKKNNNSNLGWGTVGVVVCMIILR